MTTKPPTKATSTAQAEGDRLRIKVFGLVSIEGEGRVPAIGALGLGFVVLMTLWFL